MVLGSPIPDAWARPYIHNDCSPAQNTANGPWSDHVRSTNMLSVRWQSKNKRLISYACPGEWLCLRSRNLTFIAWERAPERCIGQGVTAWLLPVYYFINLINTPWWSAVHPRHSLNILWRKLNAWWTVIQGGSRGGYRGSGSPPPFCC